MDPAGGKPTEENKFFMSEKQCGFPRDTKEKQRRDGHIRMCNKNLYKIGTNRVNT